MESHNRRLPIRRGLAKSIMAERNPSVLLVEDEPFVQTLLAAYLEKEGVAVTVASTAAEMRAALRSPAQPIDAIALDDILLRRGLAATLVFGVRLTPFAAHCWLQTAETILTGTAAEARNFTPILVAG